MTAASIQAALHTIRDTTADYLRGHGGLAPADIPVMAATLERVLRETGAR